MTSFGELWKSAIPVFSHLSCSLMLWSVCAFNSTCAIQSSIKESVNVDDIGSDYCDQDCDGKAGTTGDSRRVFLAVYYYSRIDTLVISCGRTL